MDPDLMGKDAGDVGTTTDHVLLAPRASTEGMSYPEEREVNDDHGVLAAGNTEHILSGTPIVPHEPAAHSSRISQKRSQRAAAGMERVAVAAALPSVVAAAGGAGGAAPSGDQLLIVGPGVLGSYLGSLWLEANGPGTVVGQTNSTTNHAKLSALGISPRTKEGAGSGTFPNVTFAAPPSGSADYVAEIKAALSLWDGTGTFVFTSSAGVYTVEDGSACDESAPTAKLGDNERTDRLLAAENAVLEAGGCVVRLVGLYHAQRGAHTFFLRQGEVQRWGGYLVNLIHYEDAAGLCCVVLRGQGAPAGAPYRGRVFLGCDGVPVTFEDMMAATLDSGAFSGSVTFTGPEGPVKGKRMSNPATRKQLQWEPKYPSYAQFMRDSKAHDWYSEQEAKMAAVAGMPHA
ncbi:NAD(P)-binding domain [Micractinium conductrix]|uniref:NAD(P)-binding domain n=1 Tax=Micractinium conductrix TaxID=554055 RepID=A0A2P6V2G8_9CHLO|nr:NAD(P)-binding domain [Micractinium conductrix]|eukprot:PSC68244.1 NAD(P)-binding domain [Micractinium conductrix]